MDTVYIRLGGHHVGHWPTFLVCYMFTLWCSGGYLTLYFSLYFELYYSVSICVYCFCCCYFLCVNLCLARTFELREF